MKIDLSRKTRFVTGGHITASPTTMTYSSIISRESVHITFLLAALNNLDILGGDICTACLNAPTTEKLYHRAGLECRPELEGTVLVIVRVLYGLKKSVNA